MWNCWCSVALAYVDCVTAGRGAIAVHWMLRPGACDVKHCKLAARGLLSFLSLLGAFLLTVIKV